MSYPASTPVSELILQNIVTAVAGINGSPNYKMTVRTARRWNGDDFDINEFPAVVVVPTQESHEDGRLSLVTSTMEIALHIVLRSSDWHQQMNDLLADTRMALTSDVTRGGYAVTTQILTSQVFDVSRTAEPVASGVVELRVLYRTLYNDPTTAF